MLQIVILISVNCIKFYAIRIPGAEWLLYNEIIN